MINKIIFFLLNIYLIKGADKQILHDEPYAILFNEWDQLIEDIKSNHHDCLDNLKAFIMLHKIQHDNINHMLYTFFYTAILHRNNSVKNYFRITFYEWYLLLDEIESCHPDCLIHIQRFVELRKIQKVDINQMLQTFLHTATTYQNYDVKFYLTNAL